MSKAFFGAMGGAMAKVYLQQEQQKTAEKQTATERELNLYQSAFANPDNDPDAREEAFTRWSNIVGGGKADSPGKKTPHLQNIFGSIFDGVSQPMSVTPGDPAGEMPGQTIPSLQVKPTGPAGARPSMRIIRPEERAAAAKEALRIHTDEAIRQHRAETEDDLKKIAAKPGIIKEGTKATLGSDIHEDQRGEGWRPDAYYIPQMVGERVTGWRPVAPPAPTTIVQKNLEAVARRRAMDVAAGKPVQSDDAYLQDERVFQQKDIISKQTERITRFDRYMDTSYNQLLKSAADIDWMQENQPLLLEAKRLGIEISKENLKTAADLARRLTGTKGSSVEGESTEAVAATLTREGFTPRRPAGASPAGPKLVPPTANTPPPPPAASDWHKKATPVEEAQLVDLLAQLKGERDPTKQNELKAQMATIKDTIEKRK